MRLIESPRLSHLSFDTYTEAIAFASKHAAADHDASKIGISAEEFTGTTSYAHAHTLASTGWPEGRKAVQELSTAINVTGRIMKPEAVYDVVGNGGVDVGLAIAGIPECFLDWQDSAEQQLLNNGPIVKLVFNGSVAGGVTTDSIRWRGAAVLALVDALEAAGKRVEVTYCKLNSTNGEGSAYDNHFLIEIPLKTAEYSLQPDQLVFALTHPSMNRRIGFSLTRQCGKYGLEAANLSHGGVPGLTPPEADIYLPRLDHTTASEAWKSARSARQWVVDQLALQGVTLEP